MIVVRDSDGVHIPLDPRNVDCQAYLVWLQTNTPNPYVPPPPPAVLTYSQFINLFTPTEQTQILAGAVNNPGLLNWLLQAAGAGELSLEHDRTKAGLDALVAANLISPQREAQILANQPPQ